MKVCTRIISKLSLHTLDSRWLTPSLSPIDPQNKSMEAMASPCSQCLENFQSFSKMRHTLLSVQATQLLEVFDPHKAFHEAPPTSTRLYVELEVRMNAIFSICFTRSNIMSLSNFLSFKNFYQLQKCVEILILRVV